MQQFTLVIKSNSILIDKNSEQRSH